MAPPVYSDLGKSSSDVFLKDYHFSLLKLDLKTKTRTGVEFSSGGTSDLDSGKVAGKLESKYKFCEHGLTFSEKWNTDNVLTTSVDLQDKFIKGLKLGLDATFSPQTGARDSKVKAKADFRHQIVSLQSDVDVLGGPLVNASAVFGHKGWVAGYQMAFDAGKTKLTKNNFSVGYDCGEFVVHTNVNDGKIFGASVYQRVNECLETGVNLGWSATKNETNFGFACKYALDKTSSVRAKVNYASQIGLGYQQKLREGVTLTLSTLIDGKNFQQGGHKLGLALELEA